MPNLDVARIGLIVVLVAALVGVAAWFIDSVAPDIMETGSQATLALESSAAGSWGVVSAVFGAAWSKAWSIGLGFVVLSGTVFFILRVIKWVQ